MKNSGLLLSMLALSLVLITLACSKDDKQVISHTDEITEVDISSRSGDRNCSAMSVLARNLSTNPGLQQAMEAIERHTQRAINAKPGNGNGGGNGGGGNGGGGGGGSDPTPYEGVVTIPVVVHVVYSNSTENISDQQIASQIAILNDDFNATNSDVSGVPSEFANLVADSDINFVLSQTIRKSSSTTSWGTNDAVKSFSPVVDPANNLNIWVCNIGGGILGYAQFPGGPASTDGVVVGPQFFGNTGYVASPFDEGRTTTHEVGHWLNLRHIWGDGPCRFDDFVLDTPESNGPNYGCPGYPTVNCRSNDMTMNYMDYTNDACMFMFSEGQKDRMRALFATGGVREGFVN